MTSTPRISGIVLAGGRSSRMGQDKASLVFEGQSLLQRTVDAVASVVDEVVVVTAPAQRTPGVRTDLPLRYAADPIEGEGPLIGIATGLEAAAAPVAVVVAVDMPFLEPALLRYLAGRVTAEHRWVLPIAERRPQPLCSAFARDALPVIRTHIEAGDRAPMAVAADLGFLRVQAEEWREFDPQGRSFLNVNTPEEFAAALAGSPIPATDAREATEERAT